MVDLEDAVVTAVFFYGDAVGAEGVGFDDVHADVEEGAMDLLHGFGVGDDQVVVTAVELLAAKVLGGEVLRLEASSHRAIEDEDALFERIKVSAVRVFSIGHEY